MFASNKRWTSRPEIRFSRNYHSIWDKITIRVYKQKSFNEYKIYSVVRGFSWIFQTRWIEHDFSTLYNFSTQVEFFSRLAVPRNCEKHFSAIVRDSFFTKITPVQSYKVPLTSGRISPSGRYYTKRWYFFRHSFLSIELQLLVSFRVDSLPLLVVLRQLDRFHGSDFNKVLNKQSSCNSIN